MPPHAVGVLGVEKTPVRRAQNIQADGELTLALEAIELFFP